MRHLVALLLILILPALAEATGPLFPHDHHSTLDFSLRLARTKVPLDYGNRTNDTASRWLGVSLREKAGKRVTLGMYGGYAWLTQSNNPVTAGAELNGYHAGFSLHGILLEGQRGSLYGALDYTYQKVDHKSDVRTVVIDWAQSQAQLGVVLTLAQKWRLYGGGSYGKIDGEERASGSVNHTLTFVRGARSGGFLGLDLNVEPDGYVGIEAWSSLTRGAEIYGVNAVKMTMQDAVHISRASIPQLERAIPTAADDKIAVGAAGVVDKRTFVSGPNLFFLKNFDFSSELRINKSNVKVDNDVRCFGRAEYQAGSARNYKSVLFITLGTGVGRALGRNGKILKMSRLLW